MTTIMLPQWTQHKAHWSCDIIDHTATLILPKKGSVWYLRVYEPGNGSLALGPIPIDGTEQEAMEAADRILRGMQLREAEAHHE